MGSVELDADNGDRRSEHAPPTHPRDSESLDSKGQPVDKSNTGAWKAAGFFYGLTMAENQSSIGLFVNVITYLAATMNLSNANAATQVTDLIGSAFLLSLLGGFIADSSLGGFYTIIVGGVITIMGLGLLVISTTVSSLEPPKCTSLSCKQAGTRYLAPFFCALYIMAVGSGLVRPTLVSLGGDQFDESVPAEKKQKIHFFTWFYFFANVMGLLIAFTLGVYLQDNVSRGWGYGFCLMFYFTCFAIFLLGTPRIRRKGPAGSFLTRLAQVFVASIRKLSYPIPNNTEDLYSPASPGKLRHTNKLRLLDGAAVIDEEDKRALAGTGHSPDPWRLCSVTQVEECKRLIQLLPIWATTVVITLVYAQLSTFTILQAITMDRRLGPHFVIPPAAMNSIGILSGLVIVPIYDRILIPVLKKYTGNPYGMTPLTRIGIALLFAVLTMIVAALVERKRLTYVHELHLEGLPLGSYAIPMEFWWLVPQYFCSGALEVFFYIAAYEFFYHESAATTHTVGSSFTFSSASLGFFFSSILVHIVNDATRNDKGGAWLEGQLNNGGLEKFYWLLAMVIFVAFLIFLIFVHFYQYNHDWYQIESSSQVKDGVLGGECIEVSKDNH